MKALFRKQQQRLIDGINKDAKPEGRQVHDLDITDTC